MEAALAGRRAIVTAGAGGVGLVIASQLASAGAEVFVGDVSGPAVAELPSAIHGEVVDVADADAVQAWLGPISDAGVDILVNNAGITGPTALIENVSPEEWRRCVAVCLDAQFFTARSVVPVMKRAGGGVIVNIASTAGIMGMPNRAPYVAAKFGVVGLTKTLAMELGRDNIRVNAIAPGSIVGERMDRVVAAHATADGITEEQVAAMYREGVSMSRFVEPSEIADMVLYLASDRARSISGQVVGVDGNTETLYPRRFGA